MEIFLEIFIICLCDGTFKVLLKLFPYIWQKVVVSHTLLLNNLSLLHFLAFILHVIEYSENHFQCEISLRMSLGVLLKFLAFPIFFLSLTIFITLINNFSILPPFKITTDHFDVLFFMEKPHHCGKTLISYLFCDCILKVYSATGQCYHWLFLLE